MSALWKCELEGDLVVAVLEEAHAAALFELVQECRGMPWFDWWSGFEDNRALIEESLVRYRNGQGMWAGIWSAGELAGLVGLNNVNPWHRSASLDYWLGPTHQGRGLVTRACRVVLGYGFEELNLN